jgi:hypothetical protein
LHPDKQQHMAVRDTIRTAMIGLGRQLTLVRLWPMTARAHAELARVFVSERLWDVPPRGRPPGINPQSFATPGLADRPQPQQGGST